MERHLVEPCCLQKSDGSSNNFGGFDGNKRSEHEFYFHRSTLDDLTISYEREEVLLFVSCVYGTAMNASCFFGDANLRVVKNLGKIENPSTAAAGQRYCPLNVLTTIN
jgi:hypothetical protein